MIRSSIAKILQDAVASLQADGLLPGGLPLAEVQEPKNPEHGDYATSFALQSAKAAGKNPRDLAELVCKKIVEWPEIEKAESAGPGFINLTLSQKWVIEQLEPVLASAGLNPLERCSHYARPDQPSPRGINVEFVSVNPNGPITIGSGRGAAFGSALCNVLAVAGHRVHREYYINDGVNSEQMRLFAMSVRSYVLPYVDFPPNGYRGDYVRSVAQNLKRASRRILQKLIDIKEDRLSPLLDEHQSEDHAIRSIVSKMVHSLHSPTHNLKIEIELKILLTSGTHVRSKKTGTNVYLDMERVTNLFNNFMLFEDLSYLNAREREALSPIFTNILKWLKLFSIVFQSALPESVAANGSDKPRELTNLEFLSAHLARLELFGHDDDIEIVTWQLACQESMVRSQRRVLDFFTTRFDKWFSEMHLHTNGMVDDCLAELQMKGLADEKPYRNKRVKFKDPITGATEFITEMTEQPQDEDDVEGSGRTLWLRSTLFNDDQDRVLRRRDGRLTYIASDLAYHKDKFNRPPKADKLITVLGPDHHGYIGRLRAVVAALLNEGQDHEQALATAKERLEVVIFQLVRFVKDGQPAPMRKRDGNIYSLIDLLKEIGRNVKPRGTWKEKLQAGTDVARFFYLMRSHETTFDFDLDLAQKQSDDNPVFYVQYAHARICSVIAKGAEAGLKPVANASLLVESREKALALKVLDLPYEISRTGEDYAIHRLATYAVELARTYHHFYDVCRVVKPEEPELSQARLALCEAARIAIASVLQILGVSAPERMERQEADSAEN